MEDRSDTCTKHLNRYSKCKFEGCESLKLCKFCVVDSKDDLKHFYEHFDSIQSQDYDLTKYKDQLKIVEEFDELNKIFIEQLDKAHGFTDNTIQSLVNSRSLISTELRRAFFEKYSAISSGFEEFVKSFTEKLGKLKTNDKNIIKEIKSMKDILEI